MITSKENKKEKLIEIDLTGPDGNAFSLVSIATHLSNKLGLNANEITSEMMSGDYENLVSVFDKYFGDYVILYR
jgi:hypothetical protein